MAALTNSSIWHNSTSCITLINDLVLINAYTDADQRLQNFLMSCHYVDSDCKLKDILVNFVCLEGSHSDEHLANSFIQCFQKKY